MRRLTNIELEKFIMANSKHLTISDMIEETGVCFNTIKNLCDRMHIEPVSAKNQTINFIIEYKSKFSAKKVQKMLGVSDSYFNRIIKELNLNKLTDFCLESEPIKEQEVVMEKPKVRVPCQTPREILSGYQFNSHIHYNHAPYRPNPMQEAWDKRIKNIEPPKDDEPINQ
jgi:hypothetical protein